MVITEKCVLLHKFPLTGLTCKSQVLRKKQRILLFEFKRVKCFSDDTHTVQSFILLAAIKNTRLIFCYLSNTRWQHKMANTRQHKTTKFIKETFNFISYPITGSYKFCIQTLSLKLLTKAQLLRKTL